VSDGAEGLDRARIEAMTTPMMVAIRDNYLRGPHGRDRVFEALNALAICAATVIAGIDDRGGRGKARRFLEVAINQQRGELDRNPPAS
jgi:hypothetical protein